LISKTAEDGRCATEIIMTQLTRNHRSCISIVMIFPNGGWKGNGVFHKALKNNLKLIFNLHL